MEQKKSLGRRLGEFFSEKGFYIVLLLSTAVIATSAWLMFGEETTVEEPLIAAEAAAAMKPAMPKEKPAATIAPVAPEVEQELDREESDAHEAEAVWKEEEESLPLYFIWPVSGVLERGHSRDVLLYDRTMADWRTHDGWDIQANLGGHVLAAANGTVSAIYQDDLYGTTVEISHGSGLVSCYANLAETPTVAVGDAVQVGDVIGAVGETALCEVGEAYHLHFAMKLNGKSADPADFLPAR